MKPQMIKSLILFAALFGVIAVCFLSIAIGVPAMLAWQDIKHQWTLDGLKEFERSSGYLLSSTDKLIFCEDSRGGWHGDGTLNVHVRTTQATVDAWVSQPFKQTPWTREFRRPEFGANRKHETRLERECLWAKWGDAGNWQLIIVQPETGDVWYTEYNS